MGMEEKIPAKSNVDLISPYSPSPIGFGTHKTGVMPGDHEI